MVCALEDGLYRFDEASGDFTPLRKVEHELPGKRFNDGYVDAGGKLWFGSMDDSQMEAIGSLYRLDPHGKLSRADTGYRITNGPAVSQDGMALDSAGHLWIALFGAGASSATRRRGGWWRRSVSLYKHHQTGFRRRGPVHNLRDDRLEGTVAGAASITAPSLRAVRLPRRHAGIAAYRIVLLESA